ncbi:MAG: CoA pyrophosphatase [Syntrophomonadaceae bacterium]|nr:CoA pyrophosphatase [Syntrophomonadaceae bacterium]
MTIDAVRALRDRPAKVLGHESYFESAVIVPVIKHQGQECVVLEERSHQLKINPGEICFPGGRIEPEDGGALQAAMRETCEELGVKPNELDYIGPLDIMLTPFNLLIYPFVCEISEKAIITPNTSEVQSVLYTPLDYLLDYEPLVNQVGVKMVIPADYPYDLIPHGRDYPWKDGSYDQYFYLWQDHTIWGLTARILNHFLTLLKSPEEPQLIKNCDCIVPGSDVNAR